MLKIKINGDVRSVKGLISVQPPTFPKPKSYYISSLMHYFTCHLILSLIIWLYVAPMAILLHHSEHVADMWVHSLNSN